MKRILFTLVLISIAFIGLGLAVAVDVDQAQYQSISSNHSMSLSNGDLDDDDIANFKVIVDPCVCGDDAHIHIISDYSHQMNVSFELYNAAGYPIYSKHNMDMSSGGDAVIPAKALVYSGNYKLLVFFECEDYTIGKTVRFNVE